MLVLPEYQTIIPLCDVILLAAKVAAPSRYLQARIAWVIVSFQGVTVHASVSNRFHDFPVSFSQHVSSRS